MRSNIGVSGGMIQLTTLSYMYTSGKMPIQAFPHRHLCARRGPGR